MPTFITLINFTDQGARAIRDTAQRANAFKSEAAKAGVNVKQVYWTMGGFDGVIILEAESEKAAAAVLFDLAAKGNVHTQTLRAFDEPEINDLLGAGRANRSSGKKK
jgi:uncharacterized protein with GYD domain